MDTIAIAAHCNCVVGHHRAHRSHEILSIVSNTVGPLVQRWSFSRFCQNAVNTILHGYDTVVITPIVSVEKVANGIDQLLDSPEKRVVSYVSHGRFSFHRSQEILSMIVGPV